MTASSLRTSTAFRVSVPATSANLGPGFDCLGLALNLRNELTLSAAGQELPAADAATAYTIHVCGVDAEKVPTGTDNLAVQAAETLFRHIGRRPSTVSLHMSNSIPVGSGLGSSSSAIVAALVGANALFDSPVPREELLRLAVAMEGHPDNVAPAMLGGLVLGVLPDAEFGPAGLIVRRWPPPDLPAVVVLPDVQLLTSAARAVLPPTVTRAEAIFNASRLALLVEVLTAGDYSQLAVAMGDRLHQTRRLRLIPGAAEAHRAAYEAGALGVALSGAGPSLIAFSTGDRQAIVDAMVGEFAAAGLGSRTWLLEPAAGGVCLSEV